MTLKTSIKAGCLEQVKTVQKPWGHEEWLSVTGKYVLKKIVIKKGSSLSLQYHDQKEESQYLLSGRVKMLLGRKEDPTKLEESESLPGETLHFAPGTIHRIEAIEDSVIIEASTTELMDVVRLQDDYSREGTNKP